MTDRERITSLENLLNYTIKSGYVDPRPIIRELIILNGLNPDEVLTQVKMMESR